MTTKAERFLNNYNNASISSIYEAYTKPSYNKVKIYNDCLKKMEKNGGHGFKIMGYNTNFFTCGWLEDGGAVLNVETYANTYRFDLV